MSAHIVRSAAERAPLSPADADQLPDTPAKQPSSSSPAELHAKIEKAIQHTAQDLDQILGAVTGNPTLAPVESNIQELLQELQNKQRNEVQTKDAVKGNQQSGDSQSQQLQAASQKLEEASGAVSGNSR